MQIRPVRAELFHADVQANGHTDTYDEANSHFSPFLRNAPRLKRMLYMHSTSAGLSVTYGVNQLTGLRLHEQTRKKQEAYGYTFPQSYLPSL